MSTLADHKLVQHSSRSQGHATRDCGRCMFQEAPVRQTNRSASHDSGVTRQASLATKTQVASIQVDLKYLARHGRRKCAGKLISHLVCLVMLFVFTTYVNVFPSSFDLTTLIPSHMVLVLLRMSGVAVVT